MILLAVIHFDTHSPVEWYESFDCWGRLVEEMTAEECTRCHMEITNYTFITVPQLLEWADGRVNVMLCVKESSDIPRAINTLIENNATHRAFLEVHVAELLQVEADAVAGWDEVYYVAELRSAEDLNTYAAAVAAAAPQALANLHFVTYDSTYDAIATAFMRCVDNLLLLFR